MVDSSKNSSGIVISGLTKRYKNSQELALNNLSLSIRPGEVYGFLGPNGAGKSTTIKLLMNYLNPTSGGATVLGLNTVSDSLEIKHHVGYLAGDISLYPQMTGAQFLTYMKALQPVKSNEYFHELIRKFDVNLTKKIEELSRGNRQKIAIVQAFMHQPEVLILDEPTSGLDPLMQNAFYELLSDVKKGGATVFMSSHIMSEIQKTCDRVGVIRSGKLVNEISIADLTHEMQHTYAIQFSDDPPIAQLQKVKGLQILSQAKRVVTVSMNGSLSDLFSVLAKHDVKSFSVKDNELEEEFLDLYKYAPGEHAS